MLISNEKYLVMCCELFNKKIAEIVCDDESNVSNYINILPTKLYMSIIMYSEIHAICYAEISILYFMPKPCRRIMQKYANRVVISYTYSSRTCARI